MSYTDDVSFEGDQTPMGASLGIQRAENKMAAWLLRRGIAKNERQAGYILLGVAGVAILIGMGAWFIFGGRSAPKPPVPSIDGTIGQ